MDNWVLISVVVLWLCVILLSLMVYALIRQVGILYERVAPAGALAVNAQLVVGAAAPKITVVSINGGRSIDVGGERLEKSQLLFFVSPTCPVCKTLLPIVKSVAKKEGDWVDLILASDGPEQEMAEFIVEQKLNQLKFVNSELLGQSYGVSKLPYAVLIDEQGIVRAMGIVNSREHIESLFNAKELGYSSLQEYMQEHYA